MNYLPVVLASLFALLACWHFRMALNGTATKSAVPSVNGKPLFVPSKRATIFVGLALVCCCALILARGGLVGRGLPQEVLETMCTCLWVGLAIRAIGDFRYVGFFKSVKGTPFAQFDTIVYSPLCLLLSVGVMWVGRVGPG